MSLTTAQLTELQSISETIRLNFPFNGNDQWWAAIRLQNGDLGPTSGSGGQAAFDAAIADMLATQSDIQNRQGVLGSQQTGFREATLQVVSTLGASAVPSVAKPSTTARANDDVLSADPHLVFPGVQPGLYDLGGLLIIDGDAAGDFNHQITMSAGGVLGRLHLVSSFVVDSGISNNANFINAAAIDSIIPLTNGQTSAVQLKGSIEVTTAGTLELSWSQNVSNATPTQLFLDSFMTLSELIVAP